MQIISNIKAFLKSLREIKSIFSKGKCKNHQKLLKWQKI